MKAEEGWHPGEAPRFRNEASGDSRVGGQFGVVNGNVGIYQLSEEESPEQKYKVACNYLAGNMPRRAEPLIRDAVMAGLNSAEVVYHWALAILSGRSFDHLGEEEFHCLSRAQDLARDPQPDTWREAFGVVMQLVTLLLRQEHEGTVDPEEFGAVLAAYEALPEDRRDEIRRHLDMILAGGIEDQLDAILAEEVRVERMAGNRRDRVWKFFEHVPEPPRRRELTAPSLGARQIAFALVGGVLTLLGVIPLLALSFGNNAGVTFLVLLLLPACGYSMVRRWIEWRSGTERLRRYEEEAQGRYRPDPRPVEQRRKPTTWEEERDQKEEDQRRAAFAQAVDLAVEGYRLAHRPKLTEDARKYDADVKGLIASLIAEIKDRYSDPVISFGPVEWLVRYRVEQLAEAWEAGTLGEFRRQLRVATWIPAGCVAATLGAMCLLGLAVGNFGGALGSALMVVVGAMVTLAGNMHGYLVDLRTFEADEAEARERFDREMKAYEAWAEKLADRPTDPEMARWLDYDKMYIKAQLLKHYNMTNRDLVASAVLTEAAPSCWKARVLYGPPRYSAYIVTLYLLNETGARQVSAHLDFYDGTVGTEKRMNFRYDAITSVSVTQVGWRLEGGEKKVVSLDQKGSESEQEVSTIVVSNAFRLSLNSGHSLHVMAENFDDGLLDRAKENPQVLEELVLDISGIRGALRILEAIAAEGRDWIEHERIRRARRLSDYSESRSARGRLGYVAARASLRGDRPKALPAAPMDPMPSEGWRSKKEELLVDLAGQRGFRSSWTTGGWIEFVNDDRQVVVYVDRAAIDNGLITVIVDPSTELTGLASIRGLTLPSPTELLQHEDFRSFPAIADGANANSYGYQIHCADLSSYCRVLEA